MNAIINHLLHNPYINNSWFNPFFHETNVCPQKAYRSLGLHAGTNLLEKTKTISNPFLHTIAKIGAFVGDLLTAISGNAIALFYNVSVLPIRNKIMQISNKKTQKGQNPWKPTSYKALAVDALLLASVVAIATLGPKYFVSATKPPSETLPTITHWAVDSTVVDKINDIGPWGKTLHWAQYSPLFAIPILALHQSLKSKTTVEGIGNLPSIEKTAPAKVNPKLFRFMCKVAKNKDPEHFNARWEEWKKEWLSLQQSQPSSLT